MKKPKYNPWKRATFVFAIILVVLLIQMQMQIFRGQKDENTRLCNLIHGTPAWASYDGEIISYGFKPIENDTEEIVDELIRTGTKFLYNPNCGYCKMQIQEFGGYWKRYRETGLAINCAEILNNTS